jgi:Cu/Ag efflux protein CusF
VPRPPTLLLAATLIVVATAPLPAAAQPGHATHLAIPAAAPSLPMTAGVVKKVDASRGEVAIAHDDIRNLDMPKMTMAFRVKDRAWLKKMREGDRIRFAADMVNGELTVVSYETVK